MLENRRVLVVDDTPTIHEDFRKILQVAVATADAALQDDEAFLFGTAAATPAAVAFDLDSAFQGTQAIEKIRAARQAQRPYALAFVDMRMPPGLDGVQTIEGLWKDDPDLQVVLCTAYSDYSWMEVLNRLDVRDRLLILKKPFDPIEVFQLANALTTKWGLSRQAALKLDELEEAVRVRTQQLSDANIVVQNSPVILYRLRGDPTFPLVYISHNITKLGHDPQALIAAPDWAHRLIHSEDLYKVGEARARVLDRTASGASIEFRMRTADGEWRWMENRYVPIRNTGGQLIEVEGILIDITERKAADERVARLARTDALTELANRSTFMDRLNHTFAAAQRGASPFAVAGRCTAPAGLYAGYRSRSAAGWR
jgi:PAS domain S-box-containing protein